MSILHTTGRQLFMSLPSITTQPLEPITLNTFKEEPSPMSQHSQTTALCHFDCHESCLTNFITMPDKPIKPQVGSCADCCHRMNRWQLPPLTVCRKRNDGWLAPNNNKIKGTTLMIDMSRMNNLIARSKERQRRHKSTQGEKHSRPLSFSAVSHP